MRIPKTPPDFIQVFKRDAERAFEVAQEHSKPLANGKYLHWDQLRHRTPPDNLSLDEWWFALKHSRSANTQNVPLLDKKGKNFHFNLVSLIQESLHKIDQRAGGRIGMSDNILTESIKDQYYVNSILQESITSSQLEGATTTRQIAKEMISSGRAPRDVNEQMIMNNYVTMRRIRELKNEELTKDLLLEIHRLISNETMEEKEEEGRFRVDGDKIDLYHATSDQVVYVPPPYHEIDERIDRLCKFANEADSGDFIHPIIRSVILHFWIGYVHPFVDGNGRTARAVFYWSMLRQGYWLFEFVSISQILLKSPTKYGLAYLYTETDDNDLTYFIIHQLETMLDALDELENYIGRKTREFSRAERELKGMRGMNHRQQSLILHALRNPNQLYTIRSHAGRHGVSKITARSDLLTLQTQGLFEKRKRGREFVFQSVPDLNRRLST